MWHVKAQPKYLYQAVLETKQAMNMFISFDINRMHKDQLLDIVSGVMMSASVAFT